MKNNKIIIASSLVLLFVGALTLFANKNQKVFLSTQAKKTSDLTNININSFVRRSYKSQLPTSDVKKDFKKVLKKVLKKSKKHATKQTKQVKHTFDHSNSKKTAKKETEVKKKKEDVKKKEKIAESESEDNLEQIPHLKDVVKAKEGESVKKSDETYAVETATADNKKETDIKSKEDKKNVPSDFGYWKRILVDSANPSGTKEFINLFKSKHKSIPSKLFFQVLKKMVSSSDQEVRELGFIAFNSTPGKDNFIALIGLELSLIKEAKINIQTLVDQIYTQPNQIISLINVLNTNLDNPIEQEIILVNAIKVLQKSAETNLDLNNLSRNPSGNSFISSAETQNLLPFISLYQESIISLQNISGRDIERVSQEASSAFENIQILVNNFYKNINTLAQNENSLIN